MKVVINKCFGGGFGLSKAAVKRMAELQGRECHFFTHDYKTKQYEPFKEDESRSSFFTAFDIPNPNDVLIREDNWHEMTDKQKKASNDLYSKHHLESGRFENRSDPLLVKVVTELGSKKASGSCAELQVVNIPKGIEFEIEDYDGLEHIAEKHKTWG